MRRFQSPHAHPCQRCGAKTPCTGQLEQNYDGEPPYICRAFHLDHGTINEHFICDECADAHLDVTAEAKPSALVIAMAAVLNVPTRAVELTHYVTWDQIGRGRVPSLCGTYVKRSEHRNDPSCRDCQQVLAARDDGRTAEDVFGPPSVGTQVRSTDFDPTRVTPERRLR